MKIRDAILAETLLLPPIPQDLAYQYVVAGNGLFIRAEDSRIEAMVPVALGAVHGLEFVEPYARLKTQRVPFRFLRAIVASAKKHLPNEAMYQLLNVGQHADDDDEWRCVMPKQNGDVASVTFEDNGSVIDLHSHGTLSAFFSETDDTDEQGFRFYVVIGNIDSDRVQIACRVGVYGHHWNVPVKTIFDGIGWFIEVDPEVEQVLSEANDEK